MCALRRSSDPPTKFTISANNDNDGTANDGLQRRSTSLADFRPGRVNSRLTSPGKAAPAACALAAVTVHVAEPPKRNTVYEHPRARYRPEERDKWPTQTAHTVSCGSSTLRIVWEEPAKDRGSESDTSVIDDGGAEHEGHEENGSEAQASLTPMGQVKTKLAAWSWAREEQDGDEEEVHKEEVDDDADHPSRWNPLIALGEANQSSLWLPSECIATVLEEEDEPEMEPHAPPNTEKNSKASSTRHSGRQSMLDDEFNIFEDALVDEPAQVADEEEQEEGADDDSTSGDNDTPIELRFKASLARSSSHPTTASDYLSLPSARHNLSSTPPSPSLPRQFSHLAAAEQHFRFHRDSIELAHNRLLQEEDERLNHALLNAHQDSFVLMTTPSPRGKKTHVSKKHLRSFSVGATGWSRYDEGHLPSIQDSSPPGQPSPLANAGFRETDFKRQ